MAGAAGGNYWNFYWEIVARHSKRRLGSSAYCDHLLKCGSEPGTIAWLAVLQSEFKSASIKLSSSGHSHCGRRNAHERRHQRWEIGRMMVPSGL